MLDIEAVGTIAYRGAIELRITAIDERGAGETLVERLNIPARGAQVSITKVRGRIRMIPVRLHTPQEMRQMEKNGSGRASRRWIRGHPQLASSHSPVFLRAGLCLYAYDATGIRGDQRSGLWQQLSSHGLSACRFRPPAVVGSATCPAARILAMEGMEAAITTGSRSQEPRHHPHPDGDPGRTRGVTLRPSLRYTASLRKDIAAEPRVCTGEREDNRWGDTPVLGSADLEPLTTPKHARVASQTPQRARPRGDGE